MIMNVAINGAYGKMGVAVCRAVLDESDLNLSACCDINSDFSTNSFNKTFDTVTPNLVITHDIKEMLAESPDVVIDFTHPDSVFENAKTILESRVHAVIGTTGLDEDSLVEIKKLTDKGYANAIVAPNFAIGAILMMQFAKIAAKYLDGCEIIELHHPGKADAPSGTSIKTAELVKAENRLRLKKGEKELNEGARGAFVKGTHIHSVRLPGLVAHQEVIFGGVGQTLTIRHDSISRESFMPGVIMAIKAVSDRQGLTYGLENLLNI